MGIRIIPDDQDEWSDELRQEVERIDAGGDTWDSSRPATEEERLHFRRPMDRVIPVRFSTEQWEALRQEAIRRGIGPSTLLRMWALEKLAERSA
jgi:hypothetical protein